VYLPSSKTAIKRKGLSVPVADLLVKGKIRGRTINWGSGRSFTDTWAMAGVTGTCDEYDPYFAPERPDGIYDTVYCGYVLNTLPPTNRAGCVMDILQFIDKTSTVYFAVRGDRVRGEPHHDGVITKRGTFQKSFSNLELYSFLREFFDTVVVSRHGHYLLAECRVL
jgi:ATP adenylyltransferase